MHLLTVLLLVLSIPPLTAEERGLLDTARDGAYDHQEPAFAALAAHVAAWTGEVGDAPIRLTPDLIAMREHPAAYRGDLCRLEGRIELTERLRAPWEMFEAWFVRGESGEPALVYVHRPAGTDARPFQPGQRVRLTARFLKRFEAILDGPGQAGDLRAYAAFVGAHPQRLMSSSASTSGWVLPVMAGAVGLAGVVVVLLMAFARRAARRDRERGRRAIVESDDIDEPLDLPTDPADALAVLRRHSGAGVRGAGVPPAHLIPGRPGGTPAGREHPA